MTLSLSHKAIINRDFDKLKHAIMSSSDSDQVDKSGQTLLMWAVLQRDSEIVNFLLENGASVDVIEKKNGYSTLHFAAQEQLPEIVKILVRAGADIELKDKFGNTALNRATFYSKGKGDTIKRLLALGADRHTKNNFDVTPLSLANEIANYDIVQFFE